jgi:hypothetical protein
LTGWPGLQDLPQVSAPGQGEGVSWSLASLSVFFARLFVCFVRFLVARLLGFFACLFVCFFAFLLVCLLVMYDVSMADNAQAGQVRTCSKTLRIVPNNRLWLLSSFVCFLLCWFVCLPVSLLQPETKVPMTTLDSLFPLRRFVLLSNFQSHISCTNTQQTKHRHKETETNKEHTKQKNRETKKHKKQINKQRKQEIHKNKETHKTKKQQQTKKQTKKHRNKETHKKRRNKDNNFTHEL